MTTMHFRDNGDRDGNQSKDVDGCAADQIAEVDGEHEVPHGSRPLIDFYVLTFSCRAYA